MGFENWFILHVFEVSMGRTNPLTLNFVQFFMIKFILTKQKKQNVSKHEMLVPKIANLGCLESPIGH